MLRFTHIYEIARKRMRLTRDEYALCNYISTWASHPKSVRAGWCDRTFQQKADFIGITKRGVIKMQQRMVAIGLIDTDPLTSYTRTTVAWFDAVIAAKNAEHDEQNSPFVGEQSSSRPVNKVHPTDEQSSPDPVNKVHLHNNVSNSDLDNDFVVIENDPGISILTPVEIVVGHLNSVLNPARPFSPKTKKTIQHINARIGEGYTADDICVVIDFKFAEWYGDAKMEQYIRPETLFGTGKFESYLVAAENWVQRGRPSFNKQNNRNNGQSIIADNDKSFVGAFK
jgi:uncharacterized phage protein (TIGR02220 family)